MRTAIQRMPRRRLMLAAIALALLGGVGIAQRSVAQVDTRMLALGNELFVPEEALARDGEVHEVRLNGRTAYAASVTTQASPERMLAWIRSSCETMDVPDILARAEQPPVVRGAGATVREHREGGDFYVACLASSDARTFFDRLERFASSTDLGALGSYRFFYAHAQADDVSVGAVWTGASFVIDGMFPEEGDVPGADPLFLHRPPGSVRSFAVEDERRRVVGFVLRGSSIEYADRARDELELNGFRVSSAPSSATGAIVLHAERGASHVSVVVDPELDEHHTGITVLESGAP